MDDEKFKAMMGRIDEILAHKEAVASDILYDLGEKIRALETSVATAIKDIHNEMQLKNKDIDYICADHNKRLSFVEKILLSVAGMIGVAFLGALITLVIK
jgi:hypothetical protein